MPFVCHDPPDPVNCPNCKRAAADPAFAARLERAQQNIDSGWQAPKSKYLHVAPTPPRKALPCIHRGATAPPPEGRSVTKHWVRCDHGLQPNGPVVCHCEGCGPGCPGFDPGGDGFRDPWDHDLTVAIPHLNTPEELDLGLKLWNLQTVRPYFLVIDTGSEPTTRRFLESLRSPSVEVHFIQRHQQRHASSGVTVALDLAQALCRTDHLFHTHTDLFPVRRDFLQWMMTQTTAEKPVVGWRMSPRGSGPWRECVSHTATMIHVPTARKNRLTWSLDHYLSRFPKEPRTSGWPDTESGFHLSMTDVGLTPTLLGDEQNHVRQVTEWWDHSRSYTGLKIAGKGEFWQRAKKQMDVARQEAQNRLSVWQEEDADSSS